MNNWRGSDMDDLICMKRVEKQYKKQTVLRDVSFCVHSGDIMGIIGANGCGKTTIIKILSGLVKADAGEITVNANTDYRQFRQDVSLFDRKQSGILSGRLDIV